MPVLAREDMTASLHTLSGDRDAGLYYVNNPNREARPYIHAAISYYARDDHGSLHVSISSCALPDLV